MVPEARLSVREIDRNEGLKSAVRDLALFGIALVSVVDTCLVASAFAAARDTLDSLSHDPSLAAAYSIPPDISSARASGYHGSGCMSSKYNAYREGFVFSDRCLAVGVRGHPAFEPSCRNLHRLLYGTANSLLSALLSEMGDQRTDIGSTNNDATRSLLQPIDRSDCCQWHIKRFHRPSAGANTDDDPSLLWLPTHMDPSLLSIVVHDRPASSTGGAGLQYFYDNNWHDVPVSGHDVAIILVGSVLPVFTPCRHRVRMTKIGEEDDAGHHRMAATLFLRPRPEEKLKNGLTYEHWLARTAKRYDASKKWRV